LIAPVDVGAHARRSAHKCVNLRICAYNALAWAGLKKTMKGAKVRVFVLVTVLCVRACLQERACVCMCMCVCTCRHRGQSVCVSVCVCKCVSVRVCVPVDKGGIQALPHTTAVGQAASRKHRKKKKCTDQTRVQSPNLTHCKLPTNSTLCSRRTSMECMSSKGPIVFLRAQLCFYNPALP